MSYAAKISQMFGGDLNKVTRKQLQRVGLDNRVAPSMKRTSVVGRSSGAKSASLNTGMGTGRSFIKNDQYDALHAMRGRKIMGVAGVTGAYSAHTAMRPNSNQSRTGYRGPMQTGRGVGRFA